MQTNHNGVQTSIKSAPSLVGDWTLTSVEMIGPRGKQEGLEQCAFYGFFSVDGDGNYLLQMVSLHKTPGLFRNREREHSDRTGHVVFDSHAHFGKIRATGSILHMNVISASTLAGIGRELDSSFDLHNDRLKFTLSPSPDLSSRDLVVEAVWSRHIPTANSPWAGATTEHTNRTRTEH